LADWPERVVKRMNIFLEKTAPNKIDDQWEVSVIATVKDGKKLIPNQQVQFYLGKDPIDSPEATDGSGTASKEFLLPKGIHTVFARLQDGTSSKTTIILKEEKPKKPAKIIAHETYLKGGYTLTFQVLTEEGNAVSGAILQISDQTGERGLHNLSPTDSKGITKRRIMFKPGEKEIFVRIVVLGSEISIWKNLFNN